MLRTELDGDGHGLLQGEAVKAHRAEPGADGAAVVARLFDERLAFADGEHLVTIGAIGLADNAVPGAFVTTATTAGHADRHRFRCCQAQAFHAPVLARRNSLLYVGK